MNKLVSGQTYLCRWGVETRIQVTFLYMDNGMAVVRADGDNFYVYPEDLSEM